MQRVFGWGVLPDFMNPGRGEVRKLTGQNMVPVLVTDDGEIIQGPKRIVDWARANPATAADAGATEARQPS